MIRTFLVALSVVSFGSADAFAEIDLIGCSINVAEVTCSTMYDETTVSATWVIDIKTDNPTEDLSGIAALLYLQWTGGGDYHMAYLPGLGSQPNYNWHSLGDDTYRYYLDLGAYIEGQTGPPNFARTDDGGTISAELFHPQGEGDSIGCGVAHWTNQDSPEQ